MGSGDINDMDFPTENKNMSEKDFVAEYPEEHGYLSEKITGCYSCTLLRHQHEITVIVLYSPQTMKIFILE